MFAWGIESVNALRNLRDRGFFVEAGLIKVAA